MGCLPNDLGKRNTEIGRQHYLVGLRPGLASSAFAFCWSFGLAWLPRGLCEELSLCEQRKKKQKDEEWQGQVTSILPPMQRVHDLFT